MIELDGELTMIVGAAAVGVFVLLIILNMILSSLFESYRYISKSYFMAYVMWSLIIFGSASIVLGAYLYQQQERTKNGDLYQ